ncbi:MAG: acetate--CoA ligase family protein, partial [Victivallales bacterium]|nr:acetate--CoA ligase family protein [Victivallales bacterium]
MKLHEYQAKELLAKRGLPVMPGQVADGYPDVVGVAEKIGLPVVLKAQVHVGGRGKAGGIKVVEDNDDLMPAAETIFNLKIKGLEVKKLLVEKKCDIKSEYYFGIIFDREKRSYTMILSGEGGVDIEETAKTNPSAIHKITTDSSGKIRDFQIRRVLPALGLPRELHNPFIKLSLALLNTFIELDLSLLEINPLGLDANGDLILVDSKIIADDNSLFR